MGTERRWGGGPLSSFLPWDCKILTIFFYFPVLRLYPLVPSNFRYANKNTTLPLGGGPDGLSPIFIEKGERCVYSVYAAHRRKDIYGEDADIFRPERWGEGKARGWDFLPFNGGPRICIGRKFFIIILIYPS